MAGNYFIGLFIGISNLFVYCYIGYKVSECYASIGDLLYQSNWHKLPTKYRKFLILMIQDAQKPILYHGLKLIKIDFGTFTNVSLLLLCVEKKYQLICIHSFSDYERCLQIVYDVQNFDGQQLTILYPLGAVNLILRLNTLISLFIEALKCIKRLFFVNRYVLVKMWTIKLT